VNAAGSAPKLLSVRCERKLLLEFLFLLAPFWCEVLWAEFYLDQNNDVLSLTLKRYIVSRT